MIPEQRLSSTTILADLLAGDDLARSRLVDYERGGADINDPTQGLQVKTWRFYKVGDEVRVAPVDGGAYTAVFSEAGITDLVGTFDQNMRPVVCYKVAGVTKLYWYDPEIPGPRKTAYPGVRDALVMLDDKREGQRDFSDVLLFYLKSEVPPVLYMRAQRDRYGVEYEIDPLPVGTTNLVGGGMSKNLRLRFKLVGKYREPAVPVGSIPYYPPGVFPPGYRTGLILQFDDQPYDPVGEGYGILRLDYRQFYYPPVSDTLP